MGVGTKDKPLVRTENSSLVNVSSERLCILFLLYWEVCFDRFGREFAE